MLEEVVEKGVIFLSTDEALKQHPELFKKYLILLYLLVTIDFQRLMELFGVGVSFICAKGVKLDKPLQSYFRINMVKWVNLREHS